MMRTMKKGRGALLVIAAAVLLAGMPAIVQPAAAAAPAQPDTVCIQCHGALPDRLGAPVKAWRTSIHAANGISCNSCHGGDPKNAADAMTPAKGFLGAPKEDKIPAFCGRCHVGVMKDYLVSAHGRALGKGGPTCVTCHSNHGVVKASLDLINEQTCGRCHTFERARIIKGAMQQTEGYLVNIDSRITQLQAVGVDTEKMGKELFSVRNRFHTLFHDVNVDKVRTESAGINAELVKINKELKVIEDARAKRKVAGAIVIACVLLIAVLIHLLKKTYED
jgi:hypothetical protein